MASLSNVRGHLTPIPEHTPQLAAPMPMPMPMLVYNPLSPPRYEMAALPTRSPGLPMSFYNVPEQCRAQFSTCLETQPKRRLEQPYPPTIVRTNLGLDVQRKCVELRQRFPNLARSVLNGIREWEALYEYFDAVDLWVEGPEFCFSVIHRLGEMNVDIANACHVEITAFAHDWVQANANRVLAASINVDVIGLWSYDECQREGMNVMSLWEIETLGIELNRFRDTLLHTYQAARPSPMGPMSPPHTSPYNQGPQFRRRDSSVRSEVDHNVGRTSQTFHNFMETQRRRSEIGQLPRPRGWSNDTNRGVGPRYNNYGQNRTPKNSPPRHEPIYVLTNQRGASADMSSSRQNAAARPRAFSGARNFSNESRNSPSAGRTVSEETSNRNYYNGSRFNYHSRVTSNASTGLGMQSQLACVNENNNEGHETAAGGPKFNYYSTEHLNILHYPYRIFPTNGSVTIYYMGPERTVPEQPLKTVYVGGIPLSMFLDHTFRDMMAECGTVDTISHLRNGAGSAFVLFEDETAVQKAIDKYHGCSMGNGVSLVVNVPSKSRERGHSMSSFRGYKRDSYGEAQFRGPSGNWNNGHARTNSTQAPRESYHPPIPEIPESRSQSPWKSLQDVSNVSLESRGILQNAAAKAYFQPSSAASSPKKENSPMTTPSRGPMPTPKKVTRGKKIQYGRKASQQNSTQPTPLGSPKRKSTSDYISGDENKKQDIIQSSNQALHEYVAQRLSIASPCGMGNDAAPDAQLGSVLSHKLHSMLASSEPVAEGTLVSAESALPAQPASKPKTKNKGKKKVNSNNAGYMSSSFTTDASVDTISPADNISDSLKGNASTNRSYSAPSTRQPSVNATSRKNKEPSQKINEATSTTAQSNEPSEKKTVSEPGAVSKVKNNNRKPSKNLNNATDSVPTPPTGHQKNRSTSSVVSNSSQRKADADRNVQQQSSLGTAPVDSKVQIKHEQEPVMTPSSSNESKAKGADRPPLSITIPLPTIEADRSSEKQVSSSSAVSPSTIIQSPESVAEAFMTPRSHHDPASTLKQLDEQDWPALAVSKSPATSIVDGKSPTPIQAPLAKLLGKVADDKSPEAQKSPDLKTAKSAIFPPVAVPRYFESRSSAMKPILRPPTQDEEGSEAWPFVRCFRAR